MSDGQYFLGLYPLPITSALKANKKRGTTGEGV